MPPEPQSQRRRRNTPEAHKGWIALEGPRKGRPPSMPSWCPDVEWLDELWKAWWTSPQATMWQPAIHVPLLGRLLQMYLEQSREPDPRQSSEMRQIEQVMGLTPKGMRDLKWYIPDEDDSSQESPNRSKSRFRGLQVVDTNVG